MEIIKPQPGFQQLFLSTPADIAIGGAAAGVGKSFALLMDPLRDIENPNFSAVFFRRISKQLTAPGGLIDTGQSLYSKIDRAPRYTDKKFAFPTGANILFSHMEHEKNAFDWDGSQIPYIAFDELIHFTRKQFVYLMSRNRSAHGVPTRIRATTNPEPYGWVKEMVSWYLYPDDHEIESLQGMVIPERAGKLRYLMADNDKFIWGDSKLEVFQKSLHIFTPEYLKVLKREDIHPFRLIKSFTFIPGSIYDNRILLKSNPSYLASLNAQDEQDKLRLLHGCWKIVTGEDQIFDYRCLKDMFTNDFVAGASSAKERWITADIALEGADELVIGVWSGLRLEHIEVAPKSNGKQVIDRIKKLASEWNVPNQNIIYDSDGVGGFIGGTSGGFIPGSRSFKGNSAPITIRDRKTGELRKEEYENLRSQCYFYLAEIVNECGMYVADASYMDKIVEELHATRKKKYDGLKYRIISKDEIKTKIGGRSPDYADMIAMRVYGELLKLNAASAGSIKVHVI